jgi:hypothetical protein
MKIYIHKNRRFLPNGLGIEESCQLISTPRKAQSLKGTMFRVLGCSSLISLSIIGLVGCSTSNNKSSENVAKTNVKTPSPIPTDFTSMKNKAEELAKLSPPLKLNPAAKVKGKVAWVEKGKDGAEMGFFNVYYKEVNETQVTPFGLTVEMLAYNPEEIDTLIQTVCTKGKMIARYEEEIIGYANNCKVSLIDYKNNVIFAQKTFTNSKPDKSISSVYGKSKEFITITPFSEIRDYVKSFVPEKVEASAESLPKIEDPSEYAKAADKFAKLSFPVKLDNNSKIKGKVAIISSLSALPASLISVDRDGKIQGPLPNSIDLTKEGLGIADSQISLKSSEIETLIQVSCKRGTLITKVKGISVFSNICAVNVIDYKALATVAQKTFEGKKYKAERYSNPSLYKDKTDEVDFPREEIYEYIKSFPRG